MSQQNNRTGVVSRVVNFLSGKPAEVTSAVAAQPASAASTLGRPGQAEQLSSEEMFRRITDNGRCLPG